MPEPLTITLSAELSDRVRECSASQGYLSEGEYVEDHLAEAVTTDPELEIWLRTVGAARYDAYDAHPEKTFCAEQVLHYVQRRLDSSRKAG